MRIGLVERVGVLEVVAQSGGGGGRLWMGREAPGEREGSRASHRFRGYAWGGFAEETAYECASLRGSTLVRKARSQGREEERGADDYPSDTMSLILGVSIYPLPGGVPIFPPFHAVHACYMVEKLS